ncbi:hypothetical protein OIE69_42650 [Actinacidiphila glaucinigra]|uniref:hypothetical protein n=1 Tax=Actinacidiphila glaucinigra TaxID=235986 RepID=UPI002DD808B9|nr:hypothetical protein [Actinacidiphila glaucinigra]WSD65095.1 hypothetical protein OIE69_42650 [Actinacidiphila glaucinigra]
MYQQPQRQVIEQGANHTLHIILSIFTCGLWLPIWAIAAMVGRKKTVTTYGGGPQPYASPQIPPTSYPPRGQYGPPPAYGYPQPQQGEQQQPPTG